ncbi:MAG: DinB family protein [Chitinophagaceae bacterium]
MLVKKLLSISCLFFALAVKGQLKTWSITERQEIMLTLDSTRQSLLELVRPLSEKQFYYHLDSTTWSVNDVLEHIGLTEEGYVREFWWAIMQPPMPDSYQDSTNGGDIKAKAYATDPTKGQARGTNLPLNRYCDKSTCIRVFNTVRDLSIDFFKQNAAINMRSFYVFRKGSTGRRDIRDLHQQALWMLSHCIRHTDQIRRIISDPGFPKS